MPDVNLIVDGKKLTAPAGTLLIEACKTAGIEVPSFCYYPNLSLQGACRMCVVKVEKMPKLQTACTTVVTEGMTVSTDSDEVRQARKAMVELLLGNHPLDCPVCDAGGECELQDMTFSYGAAESKFMETKNHKEEQQWSPVVYFDRPRCILCYRCVRVHLPRRRAHVRRLPLQDAPVGDEARRNGLHTLWRRLQDHSGRATLRYRHGDRSRR